MVHSGVLVGLAHAAILELLPKPHLFPALMVKPHAGTAGNTQALQMAKGTKALFRTRLRRGICGSTRLRLRGRCSHSCFAGKVARLRNWSPPQIRLTSAQLGQESRGSSCVRPSTVVLQGVKAVAWNAGKEEGV